MAMSFLSLPALNRGCFRRLTTVYSSCWAVSGELKPLASYSPTRIFKSSFCWTFLSLGAAVTTFLVLRPLLLLLSLGMTAQLPIKSLFWLRTRQVQGNSPGLASPCWRPRAGAGKFLVPHCFPELTTLSLQPYRGASNWLAEAPGAMHERPKTEWSTEGS